MDQNVLGDKLDGTVHAAPFMSNTALPKPEYQYEELGSTNPLSIRVLVILPGAGTEPIRCTIKALPLAKSTVYSAVSYTWATEDGDATKSRRIHVCSGDDAKDEAFLDVTTNCENALQQLRGSLMQRTVWIDSVCIDQSNMEERSAQVGQMDTIFKFAKHVDICINAPNQDFLGAMTTLIVPFNTPQEDSDAQERLELYDPYVIRLEILAELFTLRYFKRVWVIQEVILANKISLHVNDLIAPFQVETLRRIRDECQSHFVMADQLSHWIEVWQSDISRDMFSIMKMTMRSLATDPRDRVFAIIGLLPTHIRSLIPVDYTLSLEHVLAYAINAYIIDCGDLGILRYAELPARADGTTASTFNIEDFKWFLGRTRTKTVELVNSVYAVMQPHALIPRNQVLPRLKVLARYLDRCIQPTQQSMNEFRSALPSRSNSLPRSEWLWLIDTIRRRYMTGTPDGAILSAIESEVEHACDRSALQDRQNAFRGKNSVGLSGARCVAGDAIFEICGAPFPFLLREVGPDTYRIVGDCYLWASVNVRYWHPSQPESGLSYKQPDAAKCRPWRRQVIEVY